jgi:hypothetical protein
MPGGLEIAFHLILFLGSHTYDLKESNLQYCENRPADKGLDKLLQNVAQALRRETYLQPNGADQEACEGN